MIKLLQHFACICQFLTVPFCTGLGSENPIQLRLQKDLNAFTNLNMRKKQMPRNICPRPGRLEWSWIPLIALHQRTRPWKTLGFVYTRKQSNTIWTNQEYYNKLHLEQRCISRMWWIGINIYWKSVTHRHLQNVGDRILYFFH